MIQKNGTRLSVVVPLAPGELVWKQLLEQIDLPDDAEIILAAGNQLIETNYPCTVVSGGNGRAEQMNAGAKAANGNYLWFLHADSELTGEAVPNLLLSLLAAPRALHYFDLEFQRDGPRWMWLNEWAVRFRSNILWIPFGDQGLCVSRDKFLELGGYPEDVDYGEDHVFVWRWRQAGNRLRRVGPGLRTSARKYQMRGWGRTTGRHLWLTMKQAVPELRKLLKIRLAGR